MLSQNNGDRTQSPEECRLKSNCKICIFFLRKNVVVKNVNDF